MEEIKAYKLTDGRIEEDRLVAKGLQQQINVRKNLQDLFSKNDILDLDSSITDFITDNTYEIIRILKDTKSP